MNTDSGFSCFLFFIYLYITAVHDLFYGIFTVPFLLSLSTLCVRVCVRGGSR